MASAAAGSAHPACFQHFLRPERFDRVELDVASEEKERQPNEPVRSAVEALDRSRAAPTATIASTTFQSTVAYSR